MRLQLSVAHASHMPVQDNATSKKLNHSQQGPCQSSQRGTSPAPNGLLSTKATTHYQLYQLQEKADTALTEARIRRAYPASSLQQMFCQSLALPGCRGTMPLAMSAPDTPEDLLHNT